MRKQKTAQHSNLNLLVIKEIEFLSRREEYKSQVHTQVRSFKWLRRVDTHELKTLNNRSMREA